MNRRVLQSSLEGKMRKQAIPAVLICSAFLTILSVTHFAQTHPAIKEAKYPTGYTLTSRTVIADGLTYANFPLQQQGCSQDECGLQNFINQGETPEERAQRKQLFLQLLGVVSDLSAYRERFLKNGNYMDLFPTAYFHTTWEEMQKIKGNAYDFPVEKINQMLSFYDAFKVNRVNWDQGNLAGVEDHWREYYQTAREKNSGLRTMFGVQSTLESGVNAHVNYDLPRAIRFAYENRTNREVTPDQIGSDFIKSNDLFSQTVSKLNKDVADATKVNGIHGDLKQLALWLATAADSDPGNVKSYRAKALKSAFSGSPLYNAKGNRLRPQPATDHRLLEDVGAKLCPYSVQATGSSYTFRLNRYTNTGLQIQQGDKLSFRASGSVTFGPSVGAGGPEGITAFWAGPLLIPIDPGYNLFTDVPHGTLIGRIGSARADAWTGWFQIGTGTEKTTETSGVLELSVNDTVQGDNKGAFAVNVQVCKGNRQ